jgi:hypothetical protein
MAIRTYSGGVLIRLIWTLSGMDSWVNTFYGRRTPSPPPFAEMPNAVFADAQNALTSSGMLGRLANTAALNRVTVRDVSIPNQAEFVSTNAPVLGTSPALALPLSAAITVTSRTAKAGRSFRGRTYLAGWAETQNATNLPVTAARTSARVFMEDFRNGLLADPNVELGVASFIQNGVEIDPGEFNETISYNVATPRWTSQRRRNVPGI